MLPVEFNLLVQSQMKKLKVFQARIGFFDTVVAAPSQAAALRAWGVHQNLFANGDACISADAAASAAAIKHPEVPLRRAVGTNAPFSLESDTPREMPAIAGAKRPHAKKSTSKTKALADRSKLDAVEAALRALDEVRSREEADFQEEADALQRKRDAAHDAYICQREKMLKRVAIERRVYQKAGGAG